MSFSPPNADPSPRRERLVMKLYDLATGEDDARLCRDIPENQCREQPSSFIYQTLAQGLSKIGDGLSDSKVILPWLLGAVGAPVFLVGLLVPIRESLALLPQVFIGGVIRRFPVRKGFWVVSSLVEGACVLLMGVIALIGMRGAAAGWTIIMLLVVFSLARGVASIAAKDTLGKTVSKGRRGRVNGYAASGSGMVTSAVGLYMVLSPAAGRPEWLLFALLIVAGATWLLAATTFAMIREFPGATQGGRGMVDLAKEQISLLMGDRELQKFIGVRALALATALAGPIYVSLAQRHAGLTLDGLGWLVVASGLAGAISAAFWGKLSDRSSRLTMAVATGLAGLVGLVAWMILVREGSGLTDEILFYAGVLFIHGIAHAGIRIGRKTHVVDISGGDRKAEYVALSNTVIGVLLLLFGAGTAILLSFGLELALLLLSLTALAGGMLALTMKHAQA